MSFYQALRSGVASDSHLQTGSPETWHTELLESFCGLQLNPNRWASRADTPRKEGVQHGHTRFLTELFDYEACSFLYTLTDDHELRTQPICML